jgi:hypothetical protein
MYWKRMLAIVLAISIVLFAGFMALYLVYSAMHDFKLFVWVVLFVVGGVGFGELRRGGHQRVRRILFRCSLISLIIPLIVIGMELLFKIRWNSLLLLSASPFSVLFFASFPVALYLNWKQKKSTSKRMSTNAS